MVSYVLLEMYINKTLSFQNNEQKHFVSCVKPFKPLPKEGRWCSLGTPVSSTNKTDHHDIAEILLKVVINTKPPSHRGASEENRKEARLIL